jgi:hypothetical protein
MSCDFSAAKIRLGMAVMLTSEDAPGAKSSVPIVSGAQRNASHRHQAEAKD